MTLISGDGPIVPLRLTVLIVGENRSAAGCDKLTYHKREPGSSCRRKVLR